MPFSVELVVQQIVIGLMVGGVYALMAVGLSMIFGLMDIINFAHGEFVYLGAALLYMLNKNIGNFFLSLFLTIPLTYVVGILLERFLVKRIREATLLRSSLLMVGVQLFLADVTLIGFGPVPRSVDFPIRGGIKLLDLFISSGQLFSVGAVLSSFAILYLLLNYTKFGTAVRATFQNRRAASLLGINVNRVYLFGFATGTMLASLSGALVGSLYLVYVGMADMAIAKAFISVILGGVGSIWGTVVGGLVLGLAETLGAAFIAPQLKDLFGFVVAIIVLLVRPTGLFKRS